MTNDQFDREVRKALKTKNDKKSRDAYVQILKRQFRDKGDLINRILKDYEQ
jgi:hypothetical protein